MKAAFTHFGVTETVRSDNGGQFAQAGGSKYLNFSKDYGVLIIASSPVYPQRNRFIESILDTHFQKTEHPYKLLLTPSTTPISNGFSPLNSS